MKGILGRLVISTIAVIYAVGHLYLPALADKQLPFDDISSSYAKDEIINLHNKKILNGTSKTSFSPYKSITRAEFITVLGRMLHLEPVASPVTPFKDVVQGAWYYGWMQAAVQLELASGLSATSFAPEKAVSRQEAAVLVARALKQSGSTVSVMTAFKDGREISAWARESVTAVNKLGLMMGDTAGDFRPNDSITRQETAVLIDRVLQNDSWSAELASEPDKRIVIGWQYDQTNAQYESHVLKSNVNTLSPRWYFVGAAGTVTDLTDTSLISWAKKNDKQVWAMVGNRSDQEATHQMLSSKITRNAAVDQLTAAVNKYGLDGLNIDFENVSYKDRTHLTTFITLLAERLHASGAVLSLDVSPDLGTDWTAAFDYGALGEQADYIVMMGYDEHYGGSLNPGPNASLPYVRKAIHTLLEAVPSEKVILALPFYNRDWILKQNGAAPSSEYISLSEQNRLIDAYLLRPLWNPSLGLYTASYTKQSMKHTIWFEDGRSLIAKYKLAVDKNLAGVAYWYIGGESSDIWLSMRNAEKFFDYSF